MVPTLVEIFVYLFVNFKLKKIIMTGEPTFTASKERNGSHAPQLSIIISKVKYPLCFIVNFVQPVTQHYESRTVRKAPLQSK